MGTRASPSHSLLCRCPRRELVAQVEQESGGAYTAMVTDRYDRGVGLELYVSYDGDYLQGPSSYERLDYRHMRH